MYCCRNQEKNTFFTWAVFNKNMLLDFNKIEFSDKCKEAHFDFFNTISEINDDEQKSAPENDAVE